MSLVGNASAVHVMEVKKARVKTSKMHQRQEALENALVIPGREIVQDKGNDSLEALIEAATMVSGRSYMHRAEADRCSFVAA